MTLYRIFTENKHKRFIKNLLKENFDSYTMYKAEGCDRGKEEHSLVIEIMQDSSDTMYNITKLCRAICGYNQQEAVLVQELKVQAKLISSGEVEEL